MQLRERGSRAKARTLAEEKLRDIDEKMSRLEAMRAALTGLITACACKAGGLLQCPIIEALDDPRLVPELLPRKRKGAHR